MFVMNLERAVYNQETNVLQSHLNVRSGVDCTIRELACEIVKVTGFEGDIIWNTLKPDRTPRKLLDTSNLSRLGWSAKVDLEAALRNTYRWFLNHEYDFRR